MGVHKGAVVSYTLFGLIADMAQLGRALGRRDNEGALKQIDQMQVKLKTLRKKL